MKKTFKETIEWHSIENKYPVTQVTVLLQINYSIIFGYWYKQDRKWFTLDDGSAWGRIINSDTHVYYWAYCPNGVNIWNQERRLKD